jgi:hypothetical protein
MTNRKNKGGPSSPQGKAKVSQNAIKHGLSTMNPTGPDEQLLVAQFSQELLDFYQPNNPLAKLQIERIAVCRAKLTRLYEVERVRLQLAYAELKNQPEKVVEKLVGIKGVSKGMLMELVRHGQVSLPCGLTPVLLSRICKEIDLFHGQVKGEEHFYQIFPVLSNHVKVYRARGLSEEANIFEKLSAMSARITQVFKQGDQYDELHRPFIEKMIELMHPPKIEEELDPEMQEILEQSRAHQRKKNIDVPLEKELVEKRIPSPSVLKKELHLFLELSRFHERALEALEQYEVVKVMLLQSVTLAPSESDVLMRYQTTLERRLSGAMGELLALEKQGSL